MLEPNLVVLLAKLYYGLPVKIREWMFWFLVALTSLPLYFADLAKLLKQTAALVTEFFTVWSKLLLTCQGDASIVANANCFRVLAYLVGAPEDLLVRLFRTSLLYAFSWFLALSYTAPLFYKNWRL